MLWNLSLSTSSDDASSPPTAHPTPTTTAADFGLGSTFAQLRSTITVLAQTGCFPRTSPDDHGLLPVTRRFQAERGPRLYGAGNRHHPYPVRGRLRPQNRRLGLHYRQDLSVGSQLLRRCPRGMFPAGELHGAGLLRRHQEVAERNSEPPSAPQLATSPALGPLLPTPLRGGRKRDLCRPRSSHRTTREAGVVHHTV